MKIIILCIILFYLKKILIKKEKRKLFLNHNLLNNNIIQHFNTIPIVDNYHINGNINENSFLNHQVLTYNPYTGLETRTVYSPYFQYNYPDYLNNINPVVLNSVIKNSIIRNSLGIPLVNHL